MYTANDSTSFEGRWGMAFFGRRRQNGRSEGEKTLEDNERNGALYRGFGHDARRVFAFLGENLSCWTPENIFS